MILSTIAILCYFMAFYLYYFVILPVGIYYLFMGYLYLLCCIYVVWYCLNIIIMLKNYNNYAIYGEIAAVGFSLPDARMWK